MARITPEYKQIKMDIKDKKILCLLSENSRMPLTEISKKVRLSPDTVAYRIKRMLKLGVISRLYPSIHFKKIGYQKFHVFFVLDERHKEKHKELILTLKNDPHTIMLLEYSDDWDLEWRFIAKNLEEFDTILSEISTKYSEIIIEREKFVVMDNYTSTSLPYPYYPKQATVKTKTNPDYKADEKDFKILKALSQNSRASTYELAEKIDLSPDAIGLRIKKLHKSGIILKFSMAPNFSLLGYNWFTYAIKMKMFNKKTETKFKTFIEDNPNIIKAIKVLGTWDLLVYIIAASPEELHMTIKAIRSNFSADVGTYSTFTAYKEHVLNPLPNIVK